MEGQIDAAHAGPAEPAKGRLTPEMAALVRKRETLLLGKAHLLQQMQASQNPRHRAMLEAALADLEKQIAGVGAPREAPKTGA